MSDPTDLGRTQLTALNTQLGSKMLAFAGYARCPCNSPKA